jgi:hypothetical protein
LIKDKDKKRGESTYYLYHYLSDDEASDIIETALTFKKNGNDILGGWVIEDLQYDIMQCEILRDAIYVYSHGKSTEERILSIFKLPFDYKKGIDFGWGIGFGVTLDGNFPYAVKMLLSANKLEADLIIEIFKEAGKTPQNSVLIEKDMRVELPNDNRNKAIRDGWKEENLIKLDEFFKEK